MSTQVELSTSMSIEFDKHIKPNNYNLNYNGYYDKKSFSPRPVKKECSIYTPRYMCIDKNILLAPISEK